jgi:WD40 repeat protein
MLTLPVRRGPVSGLAYLAGGGLLSGHAFGYVHAWDLAAGTSRQLFRIAGPGRWDVTGLAVAADGSRVVAASVYQGVADWEVQSERLVLPDRSGPWPWGRCFSLAPDGRTLATGTHASNDVFLWGLPDFQLLRTLRGTRDFIQALAFAPDGRTLAVGRLGKVWRILDVADGKEWARVEGDHLVETGAFSPTGELLATTGGNTVHLWETATWRCRATFKMGPAYVRQLVFHPGGKLLATIGDSPVLSLWDTQTGQPRGKLNWQIGKLHSLAFAPDGMTAAVGGSRGLVVWDIEDVPA